MTNADRTRSDALTELIRASTDRRWSHRTSGAGVVPFAAGIEAWSHELRDGGVHEGDVVRANVSRGTDWAELVLAALRLGAIVWLQAPIDGPAWELVAPQGGPPLGTDTALVLPTSGSTGSRKHVELTRRELVDFGSVISDRYGLTDSDVVMLFTEPPFDVVVEEVFGALAVGATIAAPEQRVMMPIEFAECCGQLDVTVANLPTSYALQLARLAPGPLETPLKTLVIGGERLSWDGAEAVLATFPGVKIFNAYGLTECCVTSTVHEVGDPAIARADGTRPLGVPIGRPLDGVRLRVVAEREGAATVSDMVTDTDPDPDPDLVTDPDPDTDPDLVTDPDTDTDTDLVTDPDPDTDLVIGELVVGGRRVADGYLGAPRSRPGSPFAPEVGGTWFSTGDRVAWQPSTDLYWFLGRYDNQVKIQGQRVELEYLEQQCAIVDPGWRWAAIPVRSSFEEVTQIRLVSDNPALGDSKERARVERAIRARLPSPRLPVKVTYVHDMPQLQGDKINRRLLETRMNEDGGR